MRPEDSSAVLTQLDGVAHQLIACASPVRFTLAVSVAEREQVFRLRYATIVEEHWAAADNFPDGLEQDAYDDTAVHVVAWDGPVLAASARLVFPHAERRLPTEQEFDLMIPPVDRVVDIGRAIVAPPYRSGAHTVFAGLLARGWLEVRARGLQDLCGIASLARVERYREFGLTLHVLAPARPYWGEERVPLFLDGVEFARSVLGQMRTS